MFKRFTQEESVSSSSQTKSSVQRSIRAKIIEQFPLLEPHLDDILPKKSDFKVAKCVNRISLVCHGDEPLFFQERDGPFFPTLRLVHRYPCLWPVMQVDQGAIRFVLNGANIMCQGFTSAGGAMPEEFPANTAVIIMAEGKKHPLAIGLTKLSTQEIRQQNSGIGVENIHYLNDGLWLTPTLD
mmetsp:Transcript_34597/g.50568  ORF Transcript_34597/g.50568 Transcript_34597/m.50568 type:complete len:183 (+) Transcript_34597:202-750(+)